ncbi:MAG: hypothetical protein EBR54_04965 [Flavobacteriia bacterium]|nr:hypothetical protein [Flavobacteriia bacterium]
MKKMIVIGAAMLVLLVSCGKSGVCGCADTMLSMSKDMKSAGADMDKMAEIQKKYESDVQKCKELGEGKSIEEKMKMEAELKECDSFKEMEKMGK